MKKTILFLGILLISCMSFVSCNSVFDNQPVAKPVNYAQMTAQDTTGFVATLKTGLSPLMIKANQLSDSVSLITVTSVLTLADPTATTQYIMEFTNTSDFAKFKTIPISFSGKAGSDIKASYKNFNDSVKGYNKNAVQRSVYIRLLAYIVKGGTKSLYTSGTLTALVTPYNYPPVAVNDVATLPMNSSLNINILANDTDPESDVLTVVSTTTPAHGATVINTDGTIKYTPTIGYSGADSFGYTISDGNGNTATANVDVTILAVNPFNAVTPRPWFIIGLGDGNWNYSVAGIGVSIFPLSLVTGNVYNIDGDGAFTYTGYFKHANGFKVVNNTYNWSNPTWGSSDGAIAPVLSSSSGNFVVPTDGYYTITLNSISNTLSIVPTTAPATNYANMAMSGDFNGWSATANPATAFFTANNHQWYATVTITAAGGIKFNNNSWANSWGSNDFPNGFGVNNGPNIPITPGTYTVTFNDIDDCYYFIKH